jgi:hypothetical protein
MESWRRRNNQTGRSIAEQLATLVKSSASMDSLERVPAVRRWLERPAPVLLVAALAGLIVGIPWWILRDDLRDFALLRDDFAYVARSRDLPTLWDHLLEPHNTHVVPIFRLWTFMLVVLAGRLEYLPTAFAVSSYLGLIAAMLVMGHVVARETGQPAAALAAMTIVGISTVTHPAVTWFSASQALWAGTAALVTVALAQDWAAKGGAFRLAAVASGALLAPAVWTGGLVAGPAAIAYICTRKSLRARGPVLVVAGFTLAAILLILALSQLQIRGAGIVWERHAGLWPRPIQALLHTSQALVEVCGFANLGVDAATTSTQALALLFGLAVLHAWSRGGLGRITPLEASGATIAVGGCLLVFAFRGNLPYSSLRTLAWYHAIPQLGAILFAVGWWTALFTRKPGRLTLGQAAGVLGLVVVFCLIQVPRAKQQLVQGAPPFSPGEDLTFPSLDFQAARARYFKAEFHDRQVRALARLDRVDRLLANLGASPQTLRDAFGPIAIPGIHEKQLETTDALGLLRPRPRNAYAGAALAARTAELIDLLRPEPPPDRPWLNPDDATARAVREMSSQPRPKVPPR